MSKYNHLECLYFIAIVPPADIQDEITVLKHEIAEKYNSKHALKSPPHITLHMPFRWKDKRYNELVDSMRHLNEGLEPFWVCLKDFGFFEPRVVYVNVLANEKLEQLQKKVVDTCRKRLNLDNANYKNQPFHPHVTIGFRDLKKPLFYEAQREYQSRNFLREFEVRRITLLRHNGKRWEVVD